MFDEKDWSWINEPGNWKYENNQLKIITDEKTDFWNDTFYGFRRGSGHFRYTSIAGDFTCEVLLTAKFEHLYDQLGLMLRSSDKYWLKAGLEYSDNAVQISSVVTNRYSDWSVTRCDWYSGTLRIRLTRHAEAIRIDYMDQSGNWNLMRLAYLEMEDELQLGLMCCSPERKGFAGLFNEFAITEPIAKVLHQ